MSRIHKLENIYKERLANHNINNVSVFVQFILDADITKGKYARFLIEAFLNDKFLEEDLVGGLDSTIGQAISLFHKHKSKLPENMRSVYALNPETGEALYQSPGDLWKSVKQFQGELSGKELKKEEQEQVYRETEFVYKDEETGFQIVSPLTKASAKWWGKGTRWCTSAEKNNMFWDYAEDAPLFILLMSTSASNSGNGEKLQLWKNGNYIQFMDEADNTVSLEYIEQNWKILEPICLWLNNLKYIPKKYLTREICELAVKQDGLSLCYVPDKLKTPALCEIAINQNGMSIEWIPEKYLTKELCELAVNQNGMALEYVPNELISKGMCQVAVQQNGNALYHVPANIMTEELCEIAVKQNGLSLLCVPKKLRTKELCEIAVKRNGMALEYVPAQLKIKEICKMAVKQDGKALLWVPIKLRTKELCELAVKQNIYALKFVPDELKTPEMCKLSVEKNGMTLEYVPENIITEELCEIAVKQNGYILNLVPNKYKTKELCELAVRNNKNVLYYVPDELRTKELCDLADKKNREDLDSIPDEFPNKLQHHIKEDVFELPIKKYQEIFQEIKTLFPKKDVSLSYHS